MILQYTHTNGLYLAYINIIVLLCKCYKTMYHVENVHTHKNASQKSYIRDPSMGTYECAPWRLRRSCTSNMTTKNTISPIIARKLAPRPTPTPTIPLQFEHAVVLAVGNTVADWCTGEVL